MHGTNFYSAEDISRSNLDTLQPIFKDGKVAKQVFNAAKRVTKKGGQTQKRGPSASEEQSPSTKRAKLSNDVEGVHRIPYEIESSLSLQLTSEPEETLQKTTLKTNRAPLVLAFAVAVLKYTMPEQPMSSRLSLGQAVVSANSRSKAVSLGIESASAEEQGLGEGQPKAKVLGREVAVLKRWDYDPYEGIPTRTEDEGDAEEKADTGLPPLWGLDLEALKGKNNNGSSGVRQKQTMPSLPVHTPESARSYLLKSFTMIKENEDGTETSNSPKKKKSTDSPAEREICLGLLLQALDILFSSWSSTLSAEELDRRAWTWYVRVRPEIQAGVAGWGEKGSLRLADILSLKR